MKVVKKSELVKRNRVTWHHSLYLPISLVSELMQLSLSFSLYNYLPRCSAY